MLLSTKRSEKTSDMRKTLACWQLRRVIFRMHADLLFIMHVGTSFQWKTINFSVNEALIGYVTTGMGQSAEHRNAEQV